MREVIKKILREDRKKITPKEVHKAADSVGMKWDNNKKFMDFSEKVTGKRHIDDMTSKERKKLIKKILIEEFTERIEDYKKEKSEHSNEYFTNKKILPQIIKYLDSIINIDMIVKSNDNPSTYAVYLDDVEEISQHYCYGCSGTFHYPTGTHDLYTASDYEDNDQFTSAVEMAIIDVFGGELYNMEFYSIINKYLFDRIKKYMDNDMINDYPEEHDMDW